MAKKTAKKKVVKKPARKKVAKKKVTKSGKPSGAQTDNKNSMNGCEARESMKRALTRLANGTKKRGKASPNDRVRTWRDGLDLVMDQYAKAGAEGAPWAIRDLIDRLDGKAAQAVTVSGDPDAPLVTEVRRTRVDGRS